MSIKDLKERWDKDKVFFSQKEIGELQDFVKDILQDEEIFNLTKGIGSTPNKDRKHEFTIETSKKGRRADFVIFINGEDVVIPVEVERHNNIKKGIEQVFQYQKDWNKKYAILTDGREWRFYRSNKYKVFDLENILIDPTDFLVYWKEYIKPETYYHDLFTPSGQQSNFEERLNLDNPDNRVLFFDDITQVIKNFKGKMRAIGAFEDLFELEKNDKIAVETSYAYLIQFILYKVLVDNGYKRFNDEYNLMLSKISKALKDRDFYQIIINEIKNISEYISSHIYKPFEEEQKNINKKLIANLKEEISIDDIAPWLDIILFINRYDFSGLENEIFGYIYENFLKDLYQKKNKGQYFTDPAVVNLMLKEIGYTKKNINKKADEKKISIIDPSCGAGTFLYSAVDRIINTFDNGTEIQGKHIENLINENVFGLDIEEFPLYLAEMNILMRLLPIIVNDSYENPISNKLKIFKTKDSISEFLNAGITHIVEGEVDVFKHIKETALDYPSFMRNEKDLEDMIKSMQEVSRNRFDFVIGNPPYIGYNECCKQKIEFTQRIKNKYEASITMGNVYGVNLNTVPERRKPYSPKPNLYSFFIALGIALLKENGKLCYIIPQTILTARDLDVVRYHISKYTTIEKIITFDTNMFIGRGLKQNKPVATSSLIFVLQKKLFSKTHKVEIVNYLNKNDKGLNFKDYFENETNDIDKKQVLQSSLAETIENWNWIKQDAIFPLFYKSYKKNAYSIDDYRIKSFKHRDDICLDGGLDLSKNDISSQKSSNYYKVYNPKLNDYSILYLRQSDLFYSKNSEIGFFPGSQGLRAFKKKYKIIWKTRFNNIFQYTDEEDFILNGNQSLLISLDNKDESLFLLSLLNSKVSLIILENKLKLPNESTYIVALSGIKEYIYIPKFSKHNQCIKDEIVKYTQMLLDLEKYQLNDLIDFNTMQQKFKSISIVDNNLLLISTSGNVIQQKIQKNTSLVSIILKPLIDRDNNKTINEKTSESKTEITLHELKHMGAIDLDHQNIIKDYIDDLVFSLYFNIPLPDIGLSNSEAVKQECQKNQFYNYITTLDI